MEHRGFPPTRRRPSSKPLKFPRGSYPGCSPFLAREYFDIDRAFRRPKAAMVI
jgi:hypothetical protein